MRRIASSASACFLSMSLLVAGIARAEPAGLKPTDTLPGPAPAVRPTSSAAEREAELLLDRARAHFNEGEFREALPLVERALALTGSPRFLFNLGVLHHQLSECVPAREYFQRYLGQDTPVAAREQTLAALRELNAHCPPGAPEAPAVLEPTAHPTSTLGSSTAPESPSAASGSPPPTALVLLGLGAAAGVATVASLAMQGSAQADIDALGARASQEGLPWDAYEVERQASSADARLYRGLAIGLGAACAALVGAGVTVWILEPNHSSSLQAGGLGLGYAARF